MKTHFVIASLCGASLLSGGCASILNSGRQTVMVESTPSGATVLVNGSERGTTPFAYHYTLDDGPEVRMEVQLAGHEPQAVGVRPRESSGVQLVNALLLHIPQIVDAKNAARFSMPVDQVHLDLHPTLQKELPRVLVPITGVRSTLTQRAPIGTVGGRPLKLEQSGPLRDLLNPDQLTSAVTSGTRDSWMDMRPARPGTGKGNELIERAKVYVRPEVTAADARLTKKKERYSGPVELGINWHFFSGLRPDSVLFVVPTRTTYHATAMAVGGLAYNALEHAARALVQDTELHAKLMGHYNQGLSMSRGAEVALTTPKPIAYNSRREMMAALVTAVATVQAHDGHGSGFLISNDGYMFTNAHVVGGEALVKVRFSPGFTLDAQVLKVNKDFDLALLKVNASDLPALTLGDEKAMMLGEELHAIGTPVDAALGQSVTRGILSGMREIEGRTFIQTDVSINPGNSGGPLIDADGRVVGITTMKISGKGYEGLGFAVPISVALDMLNIRMGQ